MVPDQDDLPGRIERDIEHAQSVPSAWIIPWLGLHAGSPENAVFPAVENLLDSQRGFPGLGALRGCQQF